LAIETYFSSRLKLNYLVVLAWTAYLIGLWALVVKPLYFDDLSREHVRSTYDTNQNLIPVPLAVGIDQPNFHRILTLRLQTSIDATQVQGLQLMLATYNSNVTVRHIRLSTADGRCLFSNPDIATLYDNTSVKLNKQSCSIEVFSEGLELHLDILTEQPDRTIAVWSSPKPSPHDRQGLEILRDNKIFYPVGGFVTAIQPLENRVKIIESIWAIKWLGFALKFLLWTLAALPLLFFAKLKPAIRNSLVVLISTVVFSVLYTLTSPPLQAPDEADHFTSYAHLNQTPAISDEILVHMNKSHYDRVFCRASEKIDSFDVANPLKAAWPAHAPVLDVPERSLAGAYLWRWYHSIIGIVPAAQVLLEARLLNALVTACGLGLICLLMSLRNSEMIGILPFLTAASVPTFWFFSSHLSNHTLIVLGYMGLLAVALSLLGRIKFDVFTVALGLVFLLISMLSGRAAMPSLAAMCMLLSIGIIATEKEWMKYLAALVILLGLSVGLFFEFKDTPYLQSIVRQVKDFSGQQLIWIGLGIVAGFVSLFLLRVLFQILVKVLLNWPRAPFWMMTVAVGAWLILLILPLLKNYHLDNIEFTEKPTLLSYLKKTVLVLVTNLGIGGDDFLVIRTLWGGFGCPDNFFSQSIIDVLKTMMLTGWLLALLDAIQKRQYQDLLKIVLILLAGGIYFVLLSFICWSMSVTVVGRYNLGFILVLLSVSSFGWYRLMERLASRCEIPQRTLTACAFVAMALITFFSLHQLLGRYYN